MTDAIELLTVTTTVDALVVAGEVDASTVNTLGKAIASQPDGTVVVDLSGVEFIDSSGLRVLIEAHQSRASAGHQLVLQSPSAKVQRLLEVSGLTEFFHVRNAS